MAEHGGQAGEAGAHGVEEDRVSAWEQLAPCAVRRRLPRWDATVGAVRGASGVLVIDTGASLEEGARIHAELRSLFGLPVTQVVLTHPHFDHVLGTAAFAGAQVYGPGGMDAYLAGARDELRRDAVRHGLPQEAAAESTDALVCPQHTVAQELTLTQDDGRQPQVRLVNMGPAHSAHDLAVLVRCTSGSGVGGDSADNRNIVFCGDLVEESGEPQAGPDAAPALWPTALDRLLVLGGEDALYVPGHGAVVDAEFVRAQRDVLARRFSGS